MAGEEINWFKGMKEAMDGPITPDLLRQIMPQALSLQYVPKRDENGQLVPGEEKYEGMSYAAVIGLRRIQAAADPWNKNALKDAEFIFDRIIGKPKMVAEVTAVNVSFADLLQQWAEEDKNNPDSARHRANNMLSQWVVTEETEKAETIEVPYKNSGAPELVEVIDVSEV